MTAAGYECELRPPEQPDAICGQSAWLMLGRCQSGHEQEVRLCATHRGLMSIARCIAVSPGLPDCGKPVSFRLISKSPVPPSDEGIEHELGQVT